MEPQRYNIFDIRNSGQIWHKWSCICPLYL